MSSKELTVSCLCKATIHTFSVPASALPLSAYLCSCDISRRISGSLLTSYINITHETSPQNPALIPGHNPDISTCTPYQSSTTLTRWFCSTCGTHMYLQYHADNHFEAATGTLVLGCTDEIVHFEGCMWIEDTKDGGASQFLQDINNQQLKRFADEPHQSRVAPLDWQNPTSKEVEAGRSVGVSGPTYAHCHCRGVEFWITPPSPESLSARSPYPDLMIPHFLNQSANPGNTPWWSENGRYCAGTCTCNSCRRASGFDITFWAFVPTSNIFLNSACTKPYPSTSFSQTWGTMKSYKSSPGVRRTFCAKCGANVLWNGSREKFGREGLVDVAVGLLDARSGARAEELLSWWSDRVSFEEDAVHRGLVGGLKRGLKEWAEKRRGRLGEV